MGTRPLLPMLGSSFSANHDIKTDRLYLGASCSRQSRRQPGLPPVLLLIRSALGAIFGKEVKSQEGISASPFGENRAARHGDLRFPSDLSVDTVHLLLHVRPFLRAQELLWSTGWDISLGSIHLSTLMRRLLTGYAVSFNKRHKRHRQVAYTLILFLIAYKPLPP